MRESERAREREEKTKKKEFERSAIEVGPFPNVILLVPANHVPILRAFPSRISVAVIGLNPWSFINEARIRFAIPRFDPPLKSFKE